MATESTAGVQLLARVAALGWPVRGHSSGGRPIVAACLGAAGGPAAPLVVMAGIHGDEPASVEAVLALVAGAPALAAGGRPVWVVPALNPDGLLANRKNSARDVDLNRNFPARNFTSVHQPGYDPGAAPLCEPESALFAGLVESVRPCAVVAVHAPFACINHDGPAAAWAGAVAAACGWPARADIGYPTPGSLGSWLGVDRGLPVLTIELPPGGYAGFQEPAARALSVAVGYWQHHESDHAKARAT
jgi:murein peptide amidase A